MSPPVKCLGNEENCENGKIGTCSIWHEIGVKWMSVCRFRVNFNSLIEIKRNRSHVMMVSLSYWFGKSRLIWLSPCRLQERENQRKTINAFDSPFPKQMSIGSVCRQFGQTESRAVHLPTLEKMFLSFPTWQNNSISSSSPPPASRRDFAKYLEYISRHRATNNRNHKSLLFFCDDTINFGFWESVDCGCDILRVIGYCLFIDKYKQLDVSWNVRQEEHEKRTLYLLWKFLILSRVSCISVSCYHLQWNRVSNTISEQLQARNYPPKIYYWQREREREQRFL